MLLGEPTPAPFWLAAALMAAGVWRHLAERHAHRLAREAMTHRHEHVHDEHHKRTHDFAWGGRKPHRHPHEHLPITHSRRHFSDIHHRRELLLVNKITFVLYR